MPFDPSKPFETVKAPKFDPSQPFEIAGEEKPKSAPVSMGEAVKLGGFQGLSLNTIDELSGLIEATGSLVGRRGWGTEPIFGGRAETPEEKEQTFSEVYAQGRDIRRQREKEAEEQQKLPYNIAEFVGGVAVPIGAGAAAKSMLGAAGKGLAAGAVSGGISGMGATEAEDRGEIAKAGLESGLYGGVFGAGAGLLGRAATGLTKAGRESLAAEAQAFKRGYNKPGEAGGFLFEKAPPLKVFEGLKETIDTGKEIGKIKSFLAQNKKAYVSQMIDEGMPEEKIRAARSLLDQMSDEEYIQMMVRSDTPAGKQVKDLIARQSTASSGGREKVEDYARVLNLGIDERSAARNFKAAKEAVGIVEPAQEALNRVTRKTGEKFKELSAEAAEEFQGLSPQVENFLKDLEFRITDVKDNPDFFSADLKDNLVKAFGILKSGKGPRFLNIKPGEYADVDNYEMFNRMQKFKEIVRRSINPDVLKKTTGIKADDSDRMAIEIIDQLDDILKSSDAKIKANAIYAKMRDIEDFVFKGITRRGQVQRGKVAKQLTNREAAQQWREDLNDLRKWSDDEIFAPEDREAVKKFLQVYDEAFQKAEDANLVKGFNWAAGPSSPAIQRFLSAVKNNTEIQDLLQNPAKAVAEIDNFANSYLKQLTGKDKFNDLSELEQRAFVRAQTWFRKEAEKGLVSPQSLVDNYKLFLTRLQKEATKGGGSGKFLSGQSVKDDIKNMLTNYISTKVSSAALNELAKAAGSEEGINVFAPMKEDFKKYMMDEYGLTSNQADMINKVLPDNPLELMGIVPKNTIRNMGDVIKFPGKNNKIKKGYSETEKKLTKEEMIQQRQKDNQSIIDSIKRQNTYDAMQKEPPSVIPLKSKFQSLEPYIEPDTSLTGKTKKVLNNAKEYAIENNDEITLNWIKKAENEGADEPYIGRDFHSIYGLQNIKENKLPIQPIPVPIEKIGDLKGALGKGVLTGESDPFQWVDAKTGLSKELLKREKGKKLDIFTRSDLISHDDYIENIDPKNHKINIVINGTDPRFVRRIEPGAPSISRRIKAANKLAEQGFDVTIINQAYNHPDMPEVLRSNVSIDPITFLGEVREQGLNKKVKVKNISTDISNANLENLMKLTGINKNSKD